MTKKTTLLLLSCFLFSGVLAFPQASARAENGKPSLFNKLKGSVSPDKITPYDLNKNQPQKNEDIVTDEERREMERMAMEQHIEMISTALSQMAVEQIALIHAAMPSPAAAPAPQASTPESSNKIMVYDPEKVRKAKTPNRLYNVPD